MNELEQEESNKEPAKKGLRLGGKQRIVPKVNKQLITDLQSKDNTVRAAALVSVAELIVPAIDRKMTISKTDEHFVRSQFLDVYEEMGGQRAMLLWAQENPTEFFKMFERQSVPLNKGGTQATQIIVQSNIPASPLDAKTNQTFTIVGDGSFSVHQSSDDGSESEADDLE